jgi:hypothetical protein
MTITAIGIGYVALGGVLALVLALSRRSLTTTEGLLILAMWPLFAPLALSRSADDPREAELVRALARAQASPLAAVLPDAETARVLASRLREASARLADLDGVLARADFDPLAAERRVSELAARGAASAAATAQLRVRTLGQLRTLRERYRSELDEVGELIAQLVTQAELVRLQPAIVQASGELVRELVARVEGLGELFSDHAALAAGEEYAVPPARSS